MNIAEILYTILLGPLELFFEVTFIITNRAINNPGLSIIALSVVMNFLVLPLYMRADAMQEEERDMEAKLHDGVAHIKKTFKGDERMMMLNTYYRQNGYKPTYVLRGAVSLLLEIPFFITAYKFLSHLEILHGAGLGPIKDLGAQDQLLTVGGITINVLPILMTAINLISCVIFTKGFPAKQKLQLYGMALFFLIFLYKSPAGLVFYWTLNNLFSLVKTIFYKLKHSKQILVALLAAIGIMDLIFVKIRIPDENVKKHLFLTAVGVVLVLPATAWVMKKIVDKIMHASNVAAAKKPTAAAPNPKMYRVACLYLSLLVGLLIPSALVNASPQEFVDIFYFQNPTWYILGAFCYAIGLFMVWAGVFYSLAGPKAKIYFERGIWVICGIATIDYLFFGTNLGFINANLRFEEGMNFSGREKLTNLVVIAVAAAVLFAIVLFSRKFAKEILTIASLAVFVMSAINLIHINHEIGGLKKQAILAQQSAPHFTLSKNGKNVIVFMLDRAQGEYIPYIFNEKPELMAQFDGFTYYSNVISFGGFTNHGTPALFGGYEYTPVEINKRDTESLASKQNEALRLMPVIFDEAGYEVTVCDPPYANYQHVPDLSIYDDHPDINAYNTLGYFTEVKSKEETQASNRRNFFCYSIVKASPVLAQDILYDHGNYNQSIMAGQIVESMYTAVGINHAFMDRYNVLTNLTHITSIDDGNTDTFLMMSNETTHEAMMLQEPEYEPEHKVDNTEYEAEHGDRFTVNGRTIHITNEGQYLHYQSNMAAFIQLGKWFDYMRENGVYDNTRIIIVSDHGQSLYQMDELIQPGDDVISDGGFYYPVLLVKDFGATGFGESEEFMTNADVPTLATQEIISNPTNPATGKPVVNDEKYAHDQYILASREWNIDSDNKNTFVPAKWYKVHDNIWDKENWEFIDKYCTLP